MTSVVRQIVIVGTALGALSTSAPADEPSSTEQKARIARRKAELQTYALVAREVVRDVPLDFQPEPLLSWSNPLRQTQSGGTFLWTRSGRPQAISCVFSNPNGVGHEFTSLAETPLVATRDGQTVWTPRAVEFHELIEAPAPAKSRALRISQMRQLADRFRVTIGQPKSEVLRRLAQPLFRHPDSPTNDGAVFGFVQTTDPEALLVVEWNGDRGWRYALARMTKTSVRAELDDKLVWELGYAVARAADPHRDFHRSREGVDLTVRQADDRVAKPDFGEVGAVVGIKPFGAGGEHADRRLLAVARRQVDGQFQVDGGRAELLEFFFVEPAVVIEV